jgi:hypothetical protein
VKLHRPQADKVATRQQADKVARRQKDMTVQTQDILNPRACYQDQAIRVLPVVEWVECQPAADTTLGKRVPQVAIMVCRDLAVCQDLAVCRVATVAQTLTDLVESQRGEWVLADTVLADTVPADTVPADTVPAESLVAHLPKN